MLARWRDFGGGVLSILSVKILVSISSQGKKQDFNNGVLGMSAWLVGGSKSGDKWITS